MSCLEVSLFSFMLLMNGFRHRKVDVVNDKDRMKGKGNGCLNFQEGKKDVQLYLAYNISMQNAHPSLPIISIIK